MVNLAEFRGGLLVLAGLVILLLLLGIVTPGLPGELLLQSLQFHIIAAGLLLLVVMLAAGLRWRALLYLVVLGACAAHGISVVVDLHDRRGAINAAPQTTLDVLSYNVLAANRRAEDAAAFIIEAAPDVAVIMETPGIRPYLDDIATVLPYRVGCSGEDECDLSILSRHPILEWEIHRMWPFRFDRLITARIEKDGVPVTVVGVHHSKPYFDYASWGETQQLVDMLAEEEGDLVLAGDFNAAPWSDPVAYLVEEAGLIPGPSHPATWPVIAGPLGVPIDNMFTRGNARIIDIAAGVDTFGSNHRFLRANVGLYAAP